MNQPIIQKLTDKDDRYAYALTEKIASESEKTDTWFGYFDDFVELLSHPKSLVRNRAFRLIAANIQWDDQDRFYNYLDQFLIHITDEKPISARKCIESSAIIGALKPQYAPKILSALENADISKYKISMRPLIEKDIQEAVCTLQKVLNLV